MLAAGEAPEFIARRLVILASEDIGNADPHALPLATAAAAAVERVGLPEGRYALAQATIYLACAPKSNAAGRALDGAEEAIAAGANLEVPAHLRNTPPRGPHESDTKYLYPHNYSDNYVKQPYAPPSLRNPRFYDGRGSGQESKLWQRLEDRRGDDSAGDPDATVPDPSP